MKTPLILSDLQADMKKGCGDPACRGCGETDDEMYIHSLCHPRRGLQAYTEPDTSHLTLICQVCGKEVVQIEIAKERPRLM